MIKPMSSTSSQARPALYAVYASTSGNVELVMDYLAQHLTTAGWQVALSRAEQTDPAVITDNSLFLFGTSTWEHGRLNPFFDKLYEQMKTIDCHGKQAAFVGLGDSRYEAILFCEGMEQIKRLWLERGGTVLGMPLKINGEPHAVLSKLAGPWSERTFSQVGAL
jgi:flavodoxin I